MASMDASMAALLTLFVEKTHEIQTNVLQLMSSVAEESERRRQRDHRVIAMKSSVWQTITHLMPQLDRNLRLLRQSSDRSVRQTYQLRQSLDQSLKRETNCKRQLEVVRKVYHELKEDMEWEQTVGSAAGDAGCVAVNVTTAHHLKTVLSLIWSATQSETTVHTFVQSGEEFRHFMATILLLMDTIVSTDDSLNADIIETICGICVNVFSHRAIRSGEFLVQDWDQWIRCLLLVDSQYSLMALFNISFNSRGLEAMRARNGLVAHMARNVLRTDLTFDYQLKSVSLKLIHNLFLNSNDLNMRLKLYNELTDVLPYNRLQEMLAQEPNPQLRQDIAQLLATISCFNARVSTRLPFKHNTFKAI